MPMLYGIVRKDSVFVYILNEKDENLTTIVTKNGNFTTF